MLAGVTVELLLNEADIIVKKATNCMTRTENAILKSRNSFQYTNTSAPQAARVDHLTQLYLLINKQGSHLNVIFLLTGFSVQVASQIHSAIYEHFNF